MESVNTAVATAIARCMTDGGPLDTVVALAPSGGGVEETLPPYDALRLAKDLVFNGYIAVTLHRDDGRILGADDIANATY